MSELFLLNERQMAQLSPFFLSRTGFPVLMTSG